MDTDNKYNFMPAGTWVKHIENGNIRYITRPEDSNWFVDDGKLTGLKFKMYCAYKDYRPLTPHELNYKLTELAGKKNHLDEYYKKVDWDRVVWDASKGFGEKKAEKTFINPPEPWEILVINHNKVDFFHTNAAGFIYYKPEGVSGPTYSKEHLLSVGGKIHSVKRTSDGVVFKIGDQTQFGKIDKFDPASPQMLVYIESAGAGLDTWKLLSELNWVRPDNHKEFLKELESNEELKSLTETAKFYSDEIKKALDRNLGEITFIYRDSGKSETIDLDQTKNIEELLRLLTETTYRQSQIRMEILNKYYTKA